MRQSRRTIDASAILPKKIFPSSSTALTPIKAQSSWNEFRFDSAIWPVVVSEL